MGRGAPLGAALLARGNVLPLTANYARRALQASRACRCCFFVSDFRCSSHMKSKRGPFERFVQPFTRQLMSRATPRRPVLARRTPGAALATVSSSRARRCGFR